MAVPCARSGLQGGLPGGPKSPLPHFCIGGRRNPFAPSGGASWGGALCVAMGCPPPQGGETGAGGAAGVVAATVGMQGGAGSGGRVLAVPTVPVSTSEARGAEQTGAAGADKG